MPTRRRTLPPCRSARGALAALVTATCCLLSASPAAATAADYTWSGGGSSTDWSEGANWLGGTAPVAGQSIGTLTLPLLPSFQDVENNVSGLSVNQVTVDDTHAYDLNGDALALGSGGLSVNSATEGDVGQLYVFAPLTLSSSQTWQVTGLEHGLWQQIGFAGPLTGESSALTINLSDPTLLTFGSPTIPGVTEPNTADDELGPITINGTGGSTIHLEAAALNATDGQLVTLNNLSLASAIGTTTGPVNANDSDLTLGGTGTGPLTLTSSVLEPNKILHLPSLSLDAGSTVKPTIRVPGNTPGTDYDQIVATGAVALGGAKLEPIGAGASNGTCPPPHVGEVDTLIETTGSLSGQFGNAPEGGTITVFGVPGCERVNSYRITYHIGSSPQTVTATALPAVPTSGEAPTIAGTATEGQTLSVNHGFWTNQPSSYSDQWQRCASSGGNCQAIAGATGQTYALTAGDVGSTIRVQETASNEEGVSEPAESEPTTVVQAAPPGSTSEGGTGSGSSSPAPSGAAPTVMATISSAQIKAALARLRPGGKAATIRALLKHHGLTVSFNAPEAGRLVVQWYATRGRAKAARTKTKRVLVASGQATFSGSGTGKVRIRLTMAGKRVLRHAGRLRIAAQGVFTPVGQASIKTIDTVLIRRRGSH
jgi:hypothetical protein